MSFFRKKTRDTTRITRLENRGQQPRNTAGAIPSSIVVGPPEEHDHTGTGTGGVMTGDKHDSFSEYDEIASPATPASGKVRIYAKSDGHMYQKDDAGTETDLTAAGGGGSGSVLDVEGAALAIANTTTETTIYSFTIPGGTLGTENAVRLTLVAEYLNNSGAGRTLTLRTKYGATEMFEDVTPSITNNAGVRAFRLDLMLSAADDDAIQVIAGRTTLGPVSAAASGDGDLAAANAVDGLFYGFATEDSTGDLLLDVTVQHSAADANLSIERVYAVLEMLEVGAGGGGGGGHEIHDETTPLTQRAAMRFIGRNVTAVDNAGDDATDLIFGTNWDSIVDADDINAADAGGNVYSTLQAAIDDGHKTILVHNAADTADITIASGAAVLRIAGAATQEADIPVNLICEKSDLSFEYLKFDGKTLTLRGARNTAFACLFTGTITPGSALVNSGAIGAGTTSIPFDNGANGGLAVRGWGLAETGEVFSWTAGGTGTSGTLTVPAASRGRSETLAQAMADNDDITDLNSAHLYIDEADCQAIQCRFVGCVGPYTSAIIITEDAPRARITSNVFLGNSSWACIALRPETSTNEPQGVQVVSNVFDSNSCRGYLFESNTIDAAGNSTAPRAGAVAGNLFKGFDTGGIHLQGEGWNIAGNTFHGTTRNTLTAALNDATDINSTDTLIVYDTKAGNSVLGTFPDHGLIKIDNEEIFYTRHVVLTGTTGEFHGCIRGANLTTAASHLNDAVITNLSQRAFITGRTNVGGASLGNIVSGNSFNEIQLAYTISAYAGSSLARLILTGNQGVNATRMHFGPNSLVVNNFFSGAGLVWDLKSQGGSHLFGNNPGITLVNLGTDTGIYFPSKPTAGAAAAFHLPNGQNLALGRIAGDVAGECIVLTNRQGSSSVAGEVVIIDTGNDVSFTRSAGGSDNLVVGVVQEAVANLSDAIVARAGVVNVLCNGTVNRGDWLETSTTNGVARSAGAARTATSFAQALTARSGVGSSTVKAALAL